MRFASALGMEPPDARPEAAAAPAAEEGVPVIGQDPETAPLVEPQPEPAAELDAVRVDDVTEQQPVAARAGRQGHIRCLRWSSTSLTALSCAHCGVRATR